MIVLFSFIIPLEEQQESGNEESTQDTLFDNGNILFHFHLVVITYMFHFDNALCIVCMHVMFQLKSFLNLIYTCSGFWSQIDGEPNLLVTSYGTMDKFTSLSFLSLSVK